MDLQGWAAAAAGVAGGWLQVLDAAGVGTALHAAGQEQAPLLLLLLVAVLMVWELVAVWQQQQGEVVQLSVLHLAVSLLAAAAPLPPAPARAAPAHCAVHAEPLRTAATPAGITGMQA